MTVVYLEYLWPGPAPVVTWFPVCPLMLQQRLQPQPTAALRESSVWALEYGDPRSQIWRRQGQLS